MFLFTIHVGNESHSALSLILEEAGKKQFYCLVCLLALSPSESVIKTCKVVLTFKSVDEML